MMRLVWFVAPANSIAVWCVYCMTNCTGWTSQNRLGTSVHSVTTMTERYCTSVHEGVLRTCIGHRSTATSSLGCQSHRSSTCCRRSSCVELAAETFARLFPFLFWMFSQNTYFLWLLAYAGIQCIRGFEDDVLYKSTFLHHIVNISIIYVIWAKLLFRFFVIC